MCSELIISEIIAGVDYMKERVLVRIPAGENHVTVVIPIIDDVIVEKNEYFLVELSTTDSNVFISTPIANVTLEEDDSK